MAAPVRRLRQVPHARSRLGCLDVWSACHGCCSAGQWTVQPEVMDGVAAASSAGGGAGASQRGGVRVDWC